jgi:hypothetical protein
MGSNAFSTPTARPHPRRRGDCWREQRTARRGSRAPWTPPRRRARPRGHAAPQPRSRSRSPRARRRRLHVEPPRRYGRGRDGGGASATAICSRPPWKSWPSVRVQGRGQPTVSGDDVGTEPGDRARVSRPVGWTAVASRKIASTLRGRAPRGRPRAPSVGTRSSTRSVWCDVEIVWCDVETIRTGSSIGPAKRVKERDRSAQAPDVLARPTDCRVSCRRTRRWIRRYDRTNAVPG